MAVSMRKSKKKIAGKLGDISPDEVQWLKQEITQPLNVDEFARQIPRGMEQQVYAVSLMAIDLDTRNEAQYLHQLAQGAGISQQIVNQIHQQFGVQPLYS